MLTIERKAELFDYIASRLDEGKFVLSFGSSEWVYHEQGSPEELIEFLEKVIEDEDKADAMDALFKSFGMNGGYGEINDSTSNFFCINNNIVEWSEEKFYEEGTYSNKIVKKFENDTHYLFYVDNEFGERYYQMFDKLKEIT